MILAALHAPDLGSDANSGNGAVFSGTDGDVTYDHHRKMADYLRWHGFDFVDAGGGGYQVAAKA
jgi:hypothetical protein